MKDLVNYCDHCGKAIYCDGGFFTGVIKEDGNVICFACDEEKNKKENP